MNAIARSGAPRFVAAAATLALFAAAFGLWRPRLTGHEIVFVHIFAGLVGITAGGVALAVSKGGRLHRRSGIVFVTAMMAMTAAGAWMAGVKPWSATGPLTPLLEFQRLNLFGAILTFYLVATALLTVRRRTAQAARVA